MKTIIPSKRTRFNAVEIGNWLLESCSGLWVDSSVTIVCRTRIWLTSQMSKLKSTNLCEFFILSTVYVEIDNCIFVISHLHQLIAHFSHHFESTDELLVCALHCDTKWSEDGQMLSLHTPISWHWWWIKGQSLKKWKFSQNLHFDVKFWLPDEFVCTGIGTLGWL